MSDPALPHAAPPPTGLELTAWPAARPTGISPIQHPAWEEARNLILDLAASGPVTAVILGPAGTGKSWLLRELASALSDHGFPTMLMLQGDVPMSLSDGAALLVDDASLMDEPTREAMTTQQRGVVILAGAEWFEDELDPAASNPVLIHLRLLQPREIADFAAVWLDRLGLPMILDAPAMTRLIASSGGRVSTIVTSLAEAVTSWNKLRIAPPPAVERPPIAEAAPAAVQAIVPLPPVVAPLPPRRRRAYRPLLAGAAVAAAVAAGWALRPVSPPPVIVAQAPSSPALPPLQAADIPSPAFAATAEAPTQIAAASPPLAPVPTPDLHAAIPLPAESPAPTTVAAASPPPAERTIVATQDLAEPVEASQPYQAIHSGGPGLVLVAQRGDTLESLYGSVYRDRNAPPFAIVVAANPRPFRPGAIVVFPEPPGGWQRLQR